MFTLSHRDAAWKWQPIGTHETFEDALKAIYGDAMYRITDTETGAATQVHAIYGGGLQASTDNGATWQRIKRPGASPVIGLGINRSPLERGWHTRTPNPDEFIHNPSVDVITEMARHGAAINATNKR